MYESAERLRSSGSCGEKSASNCFGIARRGGVGCVRGMLGALFCLVVEFLCRLLGSHVNAARIYQRRKRCETGPHTQDSL